MSTFTTLRAVARFGYGPLGGAGAILDRHIGGAWPARASRALDLVGFDRPPDTTVVDGLA